MRIAQVAPLFESVPPKSYGGTERVVSYLTEEIVRMGHDVRLFASGDSVTKAELVPVWHRSLRLDARSVDHIAPHILLLERVAQAASGVDIVHFHIDYLHFPLSRHLGIRQLTTLHGRLDIPDILPLFGEFREMPVVSISDDQRTPMPWLNWQGTVHHGLPRDLYRFHEGPGEYFAFLGRISPEKRVDRAIEIATRIGIPIRIGAKVDKVDVEYFEAVVEPLLRNPLVEYVGEIGEGEKEEFLRHAIALLFPIDWPEPFGLVMIEAMACGTPVIAFGRGSVPEVLTDGVTGFIVQNLQEAVEAAARTASLDRRPIRAAFEERFTAARMAADYVRIYERVLRGPEDVSDPTASPEAAAVNTWPEHGPDEDRPWLRSSE